MRRRRRVGPRSFERQLKLPSAVALHARTRAQGYSGKADWSLIRQVKQAVGIPVIGNGDVTSVELAHRMLAETWQTAYTEGG